MDRGAHPATHNIHLLRGSSSGTFVPFVVEAVLISERCTTYVPYGTIARGVSMGARTRKNG